MKKMDYVMNNMQSILDTANRELDYYGIRLYGITLTNCEGDTYDAKFIFGANSNPSYDTKVAVERIARSVLNEFVNRYVPAPYSMRMSDYVYYF